MDLGAFANIEDLDKIAHEHNISVPRLRGYRLMKDECKIEDFDINSTVNDYCVSIVEDLFYEVAPGCFEFSPTTTRRCKKYLKQVTGHGYVKVKWDKIHGKLRRQCKFAIKKFTKKYKNQMYTFNKYCGRDDILYIHARIGGYNWDYYKDEVIDKPWFIEKVDDSFDSTYCDIYAKLM